MGDLSKESSELNISRGVSPRALLASRGLSDDSSFMPEIPDYLGYILGLMLLWLLFIGYGSVAKVVNNHKPRVVELASQTAEFARGAKAKTAAIIESAPSLDQIAASAERVGSRAQLGREETANGLKQQPALDTTPETKRGWMVQRLLVVNDAVQGAVDYLEEGLQGLFTDTESSETPTEEREPVPARQYREPSGDTLDYF